MAIKIAEYLGIRTDKNYPITPIKPENLSKVQDRPYIPCPFREGRCDKIAKGNKPVCSIRDVETETIWIVCEYRLCATKPRDSNLNAYQKHILMMVATAVYGDTVQAEEVQVCREASIPVQNGNAYSADYMMRRKNLEQQVTTPTSHRPIVLEMQGGGETSNTGTITRHVTRWENGDAPLTAELMGARPIVTNAWRRQQEQFLVKGNAATNAGGGMVFCVGEMIYDYLTPRLDVNTIPQSLRGANWTLALLTFVEDRSPGKSCVGAEYAIPLRINQDKTRYTNYHSFVQALTNQGVPQPDLFQRNDFMDIL